MKDYIVLPNGIQLFFRVAGKTIAENKIIITKKEISRWLK
jgi:hypothetical protein